MNSSQSVEVESYMRSEADRLLSRPPEEFVHGLREAMNRIFLGSDNKPEAMLSILELEKGTRLQSCLVHGIECEWLLNETSDTDRRLLYLHGGGMVSGSKETHRALASRIAKLAGVAVLVPDYPLAPESTFPAALETCADIFNWMINNSPNAQNQASAVFVAGDSAGGGLALSLLANYSHKLDKPTAAAVTFSALTDYTASGASTKKNEDTDVLLSKEAIQGLGQIYGNGIELSDPKLSPLFADVLNVPPLHMQVSESEVLFDDSVRFIEKLSAAGGVCELNQFPGMVHDWQGFSPYLPEANQALKDMASFIKKY